MRTRWLRRTVLLAALAVVAALIGLALAERSSGPAGIAVGYVPLPTATPPPHFPLEYSLPGGVTAQSALVMIQGGVARRLTVWSLDGDGPPVEIDRGVHPYPLLPDPSGTRVLYSVGRAVMVLDVPARRARIIGEMPEDGLLLAAQWSPNAQMIAYIVQLEDERVSYVAWQDASHPPREMLRAPRRLPMDVAWLADGRPVTIFMGIGPVGGLQARMLVDDWMSDERVMLPPDIKPLQPYDPWRSPDGRQQLYMLPESLTERTGGTCATGAIGMGGSEWLYLAAAGSGAPREIAFEQLHVFLDRPTWLRDGRVLLRGMSSAACTENGSGLYLGRLGEPLTRLTAAQITIDPHDAENALTGVVYAISPDERVVVWADTDLAARRSTIYRTQLGDGTTEPIYQTPPTYADAPLAFKDREMILHLVWLP